MAKSFFEEIGKELIETINSGVAVYEVQNDGLNGSDYLILDFNRTALELEGKSRKDVVGKSLFDLRPNIDQYGLIPVFRKVWKTGKPAFYPAKIYVDDSFSNWYENRIFRLSQNRIVAIFDDVTPQKTAEENLKKSEALLREVLDNLDKAIAVYEPVDNGTDFVFLELNEFGESITHCPAEEVLGKKISELFPGEASVGLIEKLRETWRTGRTTRIPLKQYQDDRITQWVENTIFKLPSGNVVAMFEDTFEQRKIENAIRDSEMKLRSYFDNAPDGFFISDMEGNFMDVNLAASSITGYGKEELLSLSLKDLLQDSPEDFMEAYLNELRTTGHYDGETSFLRKDGEKRLWSIKSVLLSNDQVMAFTRDTTELRQIQESLRKNEARYRRAEKIGQVGHWEYDIETEEFWGSEGSRRIYGFDASDALFSTEEVESCITDREQVHQALIDLIEKEKPYNLEFEIIPRNASEPRIITSTASLIRDNSGRPSKVSGSIQDVTEQRQTVQLIQAREEQYHSLFNSIRDAIVVTDMDWNIIDCNQAFLDIFQYQRDAIIGQKVNLIYADKREYFKISLSLRKKADNLSEFLHTARFRKNDGNLFPGETTVCSLFNEEGSPRGLLGVIRDISERVLLEEQIRQSQKMEAIGKLAGGVAHDFNNLLTVINGYTEMLLAEKNFNNEELEELEQIRDSGQRAAELTRQLLAFSRKQVLEPEVLNANQLIRNIEKMLNRIIGEDIELSTQFDPHLLPLKADPGQLEQIVMNLVVNARDAMPGGGRLIIETRNEFIDPASKRETDVQVKGHQVVLSFIDNGIGMPKKILDQIFEPFFTTKESGKGTGMGLSTVYGIVKQSGGDIRVNSSPGKGSSFKVYLPAVKEDLPVPEETHEEEPPPGHETILVVEDEESVRRLIKRTLEKYGYETLVFSGGLEALKAIQSISEPIDLLLTDVIMPEMSGRETADAIQKQCPNIKICFMSGYTDDAIIQQGILEEDMNFIHKPFLPAELASKIRSILNLKK